MGFRVKGKGRDEDSRCSKNFWLRNIVTVRKDMGISAVDKGIRMRIGARGTVGKRRRPDTSE